MKILVTGGAGRTGRQLAGLLAAQGHQIRIFDLPFVDYTGLEQYEVAKGDLTDPATADTAVQGVDQVLHLAAILPPASERDRARTFAINVNATRYLCQAAKEHGAEIVFTSSVEVYGNSADLKPPVRVDYPRRPVNIYGESKVASEDALLASGAPSTILRISGIAVPAFLEPPRPWPFTADQRMEFVAVADVARAIAAAVTNRAARGKILHIAGGPTWQTTGREYVRRVYEAYSKAGLDLDEPGFLDKSETFDWYETAEAQALLGYQQTSFPQFLEQLEKSVEEALG
ncbi:MAG: NAD(P)-dependent oxidoreductase [Bacteroidetes bacterium]|nr:NAD(P)-dependent oxidoreductase [Bacteroidota bacterium]MCL5025056.1 NAD(P)-dependent oxidoreductase [Chloroflexota bacterium]